MNYKMNATRSEPKTYGGRGIPIEQEPTTQEEDRGTYRAMGIMFQHGDGMMGTCGSGVGFYQDVTEAQAHKRAREEFPARYSLTKLNPLELIWRN